MQFLIIDNENNLYENIEHYSISEPVFVLIILLPACKVMNLRNTL